MVYMDDKRTQAVIGTLLRSGVLLSAAVVLIGASLFLAQYAHSNTAYKSFRGEPAQLRSVTTIVRDAVGGEAAAIIQLGLLLLIATPIARVMFSAAAFAFEHDWMYVFITLIVLAVLLFSLLWH